jgi:molecular chaperone DnaK
MTRIVPRNTTIPTRRSEVFSTTEDNQSLVRVHVVQGEREMAADNETLGRFELLGIPPAPRGVPQIEVTFDIDADGVLTVSAADQGTGREQAIRVTASGGLTQEQVDSLLKDADSHRSQDSERREQAELRNTAEGLAYSVEQTLREFGDQVDAEVREEVAGSLEAMRKALEETEIAALREAVEELQQQAYRITEAMYGAFDDGLPGEGSPADEDELLTGMDDDGFEDDDPPTAPELDTEEPPEG